MYKSKASSAQYSKDMPQIRAQDGAVNSARSLPRRHWAVWLAFLLLAYGGGIGPLLPVLFISAQDSWIGQITRLMSTKLAVFIIYLPAATLGLGTLFNARTRRKSSPSLFLVFLAVLSCLSLVRVEEAERVYGISYLSNIWLAVPISIFLAERRLVDGLKKHFVIATVVSVVIVLFLTVFASDQFIGSGADLRFGRLVAQTDTGKGGLNPNAFANLLGFSSLLLLVGLESSEESSAHLPGHSRLFSWALLFGLVGALLAAGSRGALIAFTVCGLLMLIGSTSRSIGNRFRTLSCVVLAVVFAFAVVAHVDEDLWYTLVDRFDSNVSNVSTYGGREEIWSSALSDLFETNDWRWGLGLGGVDSFLGSNFRIQSSDLSVGADGISRLNSHSSYLDWVLSFGLVGLPIGVWLIVKALSGAMKKDLRVGGLQVLPLVVYWLMCAGVSTFYRDEYWPAAAALLICLVGETREPVLHSHTQIG